MYAYISHDMIFLIIITIIFRSKVDVIWYCLPFKTERRFIRSLSTIIIHTYFQNFLFLHRMQKKLYERPFAIDKIMNCAAKIGWNDRHNLMLIQISTNWCHTGSVIFRLIYKKAILSVIEKHQLNRILIGFGIYCRC